MSSYFRNVPNIDYINRTRESSTHTNQFITTKNLFKRVKLRDDIFGNINFFQRYQVIGDERPENVAFKVYGDEVLDWVILLSNNIINVQNEWPLSQNAFDEYVSEKYGFGLDSLDEVYNILYNGVHHFETIEVRDSNNVIRLKEGIVFTPGYSDDPTSVSYPNFSIDGKTGSQIFRKVSNYEYESKIENEKRSIFVLKPQYLNIIFNDIEKFLPYTEGGSQYVSPFLKRVDDIRLYQ